jgi:hypothetical protein
MPENLEHNFAIGGNGLMWLTVLANIELALKHPLNKGESRLVAEAFATALRDLLVQEGVLTADERYQMTLERLRVTGPEGMKQ